MKSRFPPPTAPAKQTGPGEPLSSSPRGATGVRYRPLPRGLFTSLRQRRQPAAPKEWIMNSMHFNLVGRYAARAAIVIAGVYLALAVGAPFLLLDAPPSPQDVVAAQVCCFKSASAPEARPARP
jgi:hypothetical protein